ncbi:MAG: hypothetical protein C5B50_19690 [Verrucomicrobia bacterium]|nr:MAG: hypothetical protein C5B50_19690 [Verrucomicrobiota bacterium]
MQTELKAGKLCGRKILNSVFLNGKDGKNGNDGLGGRAGETPALLWGLFVFSLLLSVGCKSTHSASSSFAAVEIRGNTPGQIHDVATAVFLEDGYKLVKPGLTSFVFEKPASKLSNFTHGSWAGDEPLSVRVKVSIVPLGEADSRLECDAFMVRDAGGGLLEEESHISRFHAGPYRRLLEQVAARMNGKPQ